MTVSCKVSCPYNDRGFCARGLTAIDENGMCSMWWRKGVRCRDKELDNRPIKREPINILNIEKKKEEVAIHEETG